MFSIRIVAKVVAIAFEPVKRDVIIRIDAKLDSTLAIRAAIPGVLPTGSQVFSVNLREVIRFLNHQSTVEAPPEACDVQGVDATTVNLNGSGCKDLPLPHGVEEGQDGDEEKKCPYGGEPGIRLDQAEDAKDGSGYAGPGG